MKNYNKVEELFNDLKSVWSSEVTEPFKGLVNGFTSAIPGFGIASKLSAMVWKNTIGENAKKKKLAKDEEKQLANRLGLDVKELKTAQQKADALKAEEEVLKNLSAAADEFGLVSKDFNALKEAQKDKDADLTHLNKQEQAIVEAQRNVLDLQKKHEDSIAGQNKEAKLLQDKELELQKEAQEAADSLKGACKDIAESSAPAAKDWTEEAGPHLKSLLGISEQQLKASEQVVEATKDWTEEAGPHLKSLLGISEQQLEKTEEAVAVPEVMGPPKPEAAALEIMGPPKPEIMGPPKPEVVAQDSILGELQEEQNTIAEKSQEKLAELVDAGTKAGSIFVHDTHTEEAIESQADATGAAAQEAANEQRRKDENLQDTLEDIAENTEGGGDAIKGKPSMGAGDAGKFGGIGGAISGIGKGLGKGLGGILSGIAKGLIFWANPAIPLGAAALALAITAIGAGIAGATWILGKALPTLAEGMKSFEDLDGDKLVSAGKGMAAVAGGMAAFGVGSAVAGLGSLVGGITEGIVGLFGGDTPLEKMEKFAAYDFDEVKIKGNADAMVAYGKAMAVMGAAQGIVRNRCGSWCSRWSNSRVFWCRKSIRQDVEVPSIRI